MKHDLFGRDGVVRLSPFMCRLIQTQTLLPANGSTGSGLVGCNCYQSPRTASVGFHDTAFCHRILVLTNSNGNSYELAVSLCGHHGPTDAISLLDTRHTYLAFEARMLNSCMKEKTSLQHLYQKFQSLGLVQTQDDFSRLCGRNPTWFSSLKARRIPLSTAAAITLHMRLAEYIDGGLNPTVQVLAEELSDEIMQFARSRCNRKRELDEC